MRAFFWNVQRLGGATTAVRRAAIEAAAGKAHADITLFCELTSKCDWPPPQNLTYRLKRPRPATAGDFQLRYGALEANGTNIALSEIDPMPEATDEYIRAAYKGGNNFRRLTDRVPAFVGNHGGLDLYVWHARAGEGSAKKAVAFLAYWLHSYYEEERMGSSWMVVGDLNVQPTKLGAAHPDLAWLIETDGLPTRGLKCLDYALTNAEGVRTTRLRITNRPMPSSDHMPIIVDW